MQNWHALDVKAVIDEMQVDARHGLSAQEAASRLQRHGANEISQKQDCSCAFSHISYCAKNQ